MEYAVSWWFALPIILSSLLAFVFWLWNEVWFVARIKARYGSTKIPPGSMGIPFIGDLPIFLWYFKCGRPDDYINRKRKRYGDGMGMYRTYIFGSPSIIGCSPEFSKFVLQSGHLFAGNRHENDLMPIAEGEAHRRLRNFVTTSINAPNALKEITNVVQPLFVSSLSSWAKEGKVKALDEVKKITFGNIGITFMSFKPNLKLDMIDKCYDGLIAGLRAQPLKVPGTTYYHAFECKRKLLEVFREELERRKQNANTNEKKNDLMEGLMIMRDEEGKLLSDNDVLEVIIGLILGGYRSVSDTSAWAIYFLAKHPNVVEKLREENFTMQKKDNFISSDDFSQLKYTSKVVEEIIRMANTTPFIYRVAKNDIIYKGYVIPKDWNVLVWIRYLHTNPEHFSEPMSFKPDRWDEPAKPGTFQAFGGGPRICAGNNLARTLLTIFIHHLVVGYKWELINPDAKIVYLPQPMPEDGVEIAFSKIY